MQGLVFKGDRQVGLEEFPDPQPGRGEVVVAMRACGICGSDLNLYRKASFDRAVICGHEPSGVILERGPGVSAQQAPIGQRVMIHHYRGCGRCWLCGMGYTQMCRDAEVMGTHIHGGHAPYLCTRITSCRCRRAVVREGRAIACGTGPADARSTARRLRRNTLPFWTGPGRLSRPASRAHGRGSLRGPVAGAATRHSPGARWRSPRRQDPVEESARDHVRRRPTWNAGRPTRVTCPRNRAPRCRASSRAHGTATFDMTPESSTGVDMFALTSTRVDGECPVSPGSQGPRGAYSANVHPRKADDAYRRVEARRWSKACSCSKTARPWRERPPQA